MSRYWIAATLIFSSLLTTGAAHADGIPARDDAWTFRRARELLRNADYRDIPLNLVTREQWKARKITEPYEPMGDLKGIVIHQSEGPETTPVLTIQEYHQRVKKFADIGYHYIIAQFPDRTGKLSWRIFEGRPLNAKGAHAGRLNDEDLNPGQIGICLMGDFDQPGTRPRSIFGGDDRDMSPKPPHMLQADPHAVYLLGLLVNSLMDSYGPRLKQIMGHGAGDHAIFPGHKSCPGQGSYHLVEALRSRYGMDSIDRTR